MIRDVSTTKGEVANPRLVAVGEELCVEGMFHDLWDRDASLGVDDKDFVQQIAAFRAEQVHVVLQHRRVTPPDLRLLPPAPQQAAQLLPPLQSALPQFLL